MSKCVSVYVIIEGVKVITTPIYDNLHMAIYTSSVMYRRIAELEPNENSNVVLFSLYIILLLCVIAANVYRSISYDV